MIHSLTVRCAHYEASPTPAVDDLQVACRHLLSAVHQARREASHRTETAQNFIAEVESLRRFSLKPAALRQQLQQPCGDYPSLGSAISDCLFSWLPEHKPLASARRERAPDKFLRRLYATIAFLLNVDFNFLYPAAPPPACQLVVTNEDQD